MARLTSKDYWDEVHGSVQAVVPPAGRPAWRVWVKIMMKRLHADVLLGYRCDYTDFVLWETLFPTYLPKGEGLKVIEIGSAPGTSLVKFHTRFGYEPYGVEYSDVGVQVNRDTFMADGINPDNVIHADAFSDAFLSRYGSQFDVVMSQGFIEHFSDPGAVVDMHMTLLKPGGYLVALIPNVAGINRVMACIFNRARISLHNLRIMDKKVFAKLFDRQDITRLYCDYCGMFSFGLFSTPRGSPMRHVLAACKWLQAYSSIMVRLVLRGRDPRSRTSPILVYVGRKLADTDL